MKIERDGAHVLKLMRLAAHAFDCVLVYLIDCHIKADVACRRVFNVVHDCIVCVAADLVVRFAVAVKAEQNQVCFRQINRVRAVRDHIDDKKAHLLCFNNKVAYSLCAVFPHERFATAKKQNAHAHIEKRLHFTLYLLIRVNDGRYVVDRTVLARKIAFICNNDRAENRVFFMEENSLYAECGKLPKRRKLHNVKTIQENSPDDKCAKLVTARAV